MHSYVPTVAVAEDPARVADVDDISLCRRDLVFVPGSTTTELLPKACSPWLPCARPSRGVWMYRRVRVHARARLMPRRD